NLAVVELDYPGTLPVLNETAVEYGMKAAMALNMQIATDTKFDRKNYYYPDNPKAYQISQFDKPIGEHGSLDIEIDGEKKTIGITSLDLEENAGKSNNKDEYAIVELYRKGKA